MKKQIYIVHRWGGTVNDDWYPWLKGELDDRDFEVNLTQFPDTEAPAIESWVSKLQEIVVDPTKEAYFIGHSIGCQTIFRYLEILTDDVRVGGVISVAGWINLINIEDEESQEIAKPWIETPIIWDKVRMHTDKFTMFFSDNDPWVPLSDAKIFAEYLNSKNITLKQRGHFNNPRLPELLTEITNLMQ
jgi:predicted alpha/beta hydrolase family esterase